MRRAKGALHKVSCLVEIKRKLLSQMHATARQVNTLHCGVSKESIIKFLIKIMHLPSWNLQGKLPLAYYISTTRHSDAFKQDEESIYYHGLQLSWKISFGWEKFKKFHVYKSWISLWCNVVF